MEYVVHLLIMLFFVLVLPKLPRGFYISFIKLHSPLNSSVGGCKHFMPPHHGKAS
jgi:hypothetical protein